VYELLEPLLKDYRKLRQRNMLGYSLTYIDEFVYALLTEERVCDIILPRLIKRQVLEENGDIGPRKSRLLDAMEGRSDPGRDRGRSRSQSQSSHRSSNDMIRKASSRGGTRSRSRSLSKGSSRSDAHYVSRSPSRLRSQSQSSFRSRTHSISPDRIAMDVSN